MALKRTRVISNAPELGTIWAQVPGPVVHTGPLVEKCDVDDFMGRGTSEKHVVPLLLVLQLGVREMLGYELNALAIVLRFEFVRVDDDCVALLRRMNAGSLLTVQLPHCRPPGSGRGCGTVLVGMVVPLLTMVPLLWRPRKTSVRPARMLPTSVRRK